MIEPFGLIFLLQFVSPFSTTTYLLHTTCLLFFAVLGLPDALLSPSRNGPLQPLYSQFSFDHPGNLYWDGPPQPNCVGHFPPESRVLVCRSPHRGHSVPTYYLPYGQPATADHHTPTSLPVHDARPVILSASALAHLQGEPLSVHPSPRCALRVDSSPVALRCALPFLRTTASTLRSASPVTGRQLLLR